MRRRCSLLIERISDTGTTTVLVDTSPDMRAQLLDAGVGALDAVLFTHEHADHTHGIDDLRMIVINMRQKVQVWADAPTRKSLLARFGYAFETPEGSAYPPILELNDITGSFAINGPGGLIPIKPFALPHGTISTTCFRVGGLAYCPDVSAIPQAAAANLVDLDWLIIDALRYSPHPSHANLDQALAWIDEFAPKQALLTNLHIDLDYKTLANETPDNVMPAFDGMVIERPC